MQVTLTIDHALVQQAKRAAAEAGLTLSDLVSLALRGTLSRKHSEGRKPTRLTTAGHGSRPVPGLDFADNAAVRAAMDEYERRQLTVGDQ